MTARGEIGSWILVTVVAVMIWIWAAGETREEQRINTGDITILVDDSVVEPDVATAIVFLEGSRGALGRAQDLLGEGIELRLPPGESRVIRLREELQRQKDLMNLGVTVLEVDPPTLDVRVGKRITRRFPIESDLPNAVNVSLDVTEVTVTAPDWINITSLRPGLDGEAVEAIGEIGSFSERLRVVLPPQYDDPKITIDPTHVNASFDIESRVVTHVIGSVRVQVAGPHEDWGDYSVEVTPKQLLRVTVSGEASLIQSIQRGDYQQVFAVVYLSSAEKEARLERKLVSGVMVVRPDRGDVVLLDLLDAAGVERPQVDLSITPRTTDDP